MQIASTTTDVCCWVCGARTERLEEYEPLALHLCRSCGFAFQPTIDPDAIRASYDPAYFQDYFDGCSYAEDVAQRRHEARARVGLISEAVAPPGRVLEVGSATGFFLSEAAAAGWRATGIEPCEPVAREAIEKLGTDTVVGFVEDLDLENGAYDVVCGWHVLEHIPEPVPTLERLRASLRPGGWAFFEVPNFGSRRSKVEGPRWAYLDPEHHVNQFSPASLRKTLTQAGFEAAATSTVSTFTYMPLGRAVRPRALLRRARHYVRSATWTGSDPDGLDLLRVAARAPRRSSTRQP